jgi:hypothetical protein
MEDLSSVPVPEEEPTTPAEETEATEETKTEEPTAPDYGEEIAKLKEDIGGISVVLSELNAKIDNVIKPAPVPETKEDDDYDPPKSFKEWEERNRQIAREEFEKAEAERLEKEKERAKYEQEQEEKANQYIDEQLAKLEKQGLLPKISNVGDENDPGIKARQELFSYANYLKTYDLVATAEALKVLHEAGKSFDYRVGKIIDSGRQPEGLEAPIASSTHTTPPSSGVKPEEIVAARSFEDIDPLKF